MGGGAGSASVLPQKHYAYTLYTYVQCFQLL